MIWRATSGSVPYFERRPGGLFRRTAGAGVELQKSHPVALNESSAGKHSGTVQCRFDAIDPNLEIQNGRILKITPSYSLLRSERR